MIQLPNVIIEIDGPRTGRTPVTGQTILHLSGAAQDILNDLRPILILPRKAVVLTQAELRKPIRNPNYAVRLMAVVRSVRPDVYIGTFTGPSPLWIVHDCLHAMKDCFFDGTGWDMRGGPQVEADRIREAITACRQLGPDVPPDQEVRAWIDFEDRFGVKPPPYAGTEILDGGS